MDSVNPFASAGRWLVVTASGAQHLIDSTDPAKTVTVVRVAPDGPSTNQEFELARLRRDGTPIRLLAAASPSDPDPIPDVTVGAPMVLTLEPLAEWASVTVRHTTPVVSIVRLDAQATTAVGSDEGGDDRPSASPPTTSTPCAREDRQPAARRGERRQP